MQLMLTLLSQIHALLGRSRVTRRLSRALRVGQLGRAWLWRAVLPHELARPDDVTVVIAVRNRCDYRLINALSSIRAQTHPGGLVHILVVDYGSEPACELLTAALCQAHGAEYVRVDGAPVWSCSRSLNVGVRRASTKYLMTSDADIVFSRQYLSDSIAALRESPLSVVYSPMLDLSKKLIEVVKRAADLGKDLDLEQWKECCSRRFGWAFHPSIAFTFTAFYQCIRGYDEFYEVYGSEDDDLMRRFNYLGLQPKILDAGSFYMHQWHTKFEGVPGGKHNNQIQRNRTYFGRMHSIVRNNYGWGHLIGDSEEDGVKLVHTITRRIVEPDAK